MCRRDFADYGRRTIESTIDEWVIGTNGERDRMIMRIYILDGVTLEQLQKRLETNGYYLSIDRLKQIIPVRQEQIKKHLNNTQNIP